MGAHRLPQKVKLMAGLLSGDEELFGKAEDLLVKEFKNRVDYESAVMDFTHTDYYNEEIGPGLKRKFISFKEIVSLDDIAEVKIGTNAIEKALSSSGKRRINIDPGYLDLSKLVLLSTKDYSHRIHVGKGIFAEVTLFYKDKSFNSWPWTYPDYMTDGYKAVFNDIRERYKKDIGR